jgi:hypothetical protein
MNGRRQFFSAIGLGSLFAGMAAAVPDDVFAAPEKARPALRPMPPEERPEYKVVAVPAGDSVENVFNAVTREGFQYAGSTHRYGQTEFIFVKWVSVGPTLTGSDKVVPLER